MAIRKVVEKGGEYLIPFAKKKLALLKTRLGKISQNSLSQTVFSDGGTTVKISTTKGIDLVRITAGKIYNVYLCQFREGKLVWWATRDFEKWDEITELEGYGPHICVIGKYIYATTELIDFNLLYPAKIIQIRNKLVKEEWSDTIPFHVPPFGSPPFPVYHVIAGIFPNITLAVANGVGHEVNLTSYQVNQEIMGGVITGKLSNYLITRQFLYFITQISDDVLLGFKFFEQGDEGYAPQIYRYLISTQTWAPIANTPELFKGYSDEALVGDGPTAHEQIALTNIEWTRSNNFLRSLALDKGPYVFFNYKDKLAFWAIVKDDDYKEFGQSHDADVYRRWYRLYSSSDIGLTWQSEYLYYFETTHFKEHVASPTAENEPDSIIIPFTLSEGPHITGFWFYSYYGFQYVVFQDKEDSNNDFGVFMVANNDGTNYQVEFYNWGESIPFKKINRDEVFNPVGYNWPELIVSEQFINFWPRMFRNKDDIILHFMSTLWLYTSPAKLDTFFVRVHRFYKSSDYGVNFHQIYLPDEITQNGFRRMLSAQHACGMYLHNDLKKWGG